MNPWLLSHAGKDLRLSLKPEEIIYYPYLTFKLVNLILSYFFSFYTVNSCSCIPLGQCAQVGGLKEKQ